MSNQHVIRAWKDEKYRQSLSTSELAQLPENPAGLTELNDEDLSSVNGAWSPAIVTVIVGTLATYTHSRSCWRRGRRC
jgi:mersacidin/lichenicidin family type 2 lantibiotic